MKISPQITASAFTGEFAPAKRPAPRQRNKTRLCTVYLFAAASTESDEGLCRVKNISDQGMMMVTGLDVAVGEQISVTLSDAITLSAEIIWADAGQVGLHFSRPIDSASVLQALTEKDSRTHRPPARSPSPPMTASSFAPARRRPPARLIPSRSSTFAAIRPGRSAWSRRRRA